MRGGSGFVLQDRDRHVLRELAVMRIADRVQLKLVGGFSSDSRTNRRLHKLTQSGLVTRFFLGTTGPGQKALYTLSKRGAFVIAVPYRTVQRIKSESLVGDRFVAHQLEINRVYNALKYLPLPAGITLVRWRTFAEPLSRNTRLIPDGYFELRTLDGGQAAYLEVDLGQERGPMWLKKVRSYIDLAESLEDQRSLGRGQFIVVVITTTERRLASLRDVVASLTERIFYFATVATIQDEGLFGKVWLRPKGIERGYLVKCCE